MKNNKKKLSKLLIPLLALSAVNVNAMEKPMKRNSTIGKLRRYQTDKFKNLKTKSDEFGNFVKQRKNILVENFNAVKKDRQGVIRYKGSALDGLKRAGYLLPEEKHQEIIKKYNLHTTRISAHGHTGSFVKCKKGDKWYGIKYDPNPNTTGIETYNNNTYHNGDYIRESRFYQDAETLFKGKEWATHQYDKFEDEFGTYRVVDYVDGYTMKEYCEKLKNETFLERLEEFVDKGTQILNIVHDYEEKGKINPDLHHLNLMVTRGKGGKGGKVKVVDHGKYQDLPTSYYASNKKLTDAFIMAIAPILNTLDINDLAKCYWKAVGDYGEKGYYSFRFKSPEYLKACVYHSLKEGLDDLQQDIRNIEDIRNIGKFNAEASKYKNADHDKRHKLIHDIDLFLKGMKYDRTYEKAKELLKS